VIENSWQLKEMTTKKGGDQKLLIMATKSSFESPQGPISIALIILGQSKMGFDLG
jgi:hypothetical protein